MTRLELLEIKNVLLRKCLNQHELREEVNDDLEAKSVINGRIDAYNDMISYIDKIINELKAVEPDTSKLIRDVFGLSEVMESDT